MTACSSYGRLSGQLRPLKGPEMKVFTGRERGNVVVVGQESCCKLPTCPCAKLKHSDTNQSLSCSQTPESGQKYHLSDYYTLSGYHTQRPGSLANVEADADDLYTTSRRPEPVANTMPTEGAEKHHCYGSAMLCISYPRIPPAHRCQYLPSCVYEVACPTRVQRS
jgi:hypothetical protein